MVKDLCEQRGGTWNWNFSWRRNLFQWEEGIVTRLQELVDPVILSSEEDRWWWRPDPDGEFTVNSSYKFLMGESWLGEELEVDAAWIFGQLWESPAPSKVIAFSWQLLYDRIPTRRNLEVRGILGRDTPWECLGCVGMVESSLHLFLHCPSAMMVWYEMFRWLGVIIVIPPSLFLLFEVMRGSAKNVKMQKGFVMIWHATIWSLWKARNNSMFSNVSFTPKTIVDDIKVLSWKWSITRLKVSPSMFYEWSWDPGDCLLR
ncbi:hypothetical protein TSUD_217180 [Trifolium subterraneum]|uniref:Reverse transcriptase zinc-binding domain-containing protein n=1 Tax=Trifolium subterraneum TaxID=3900 RepID=A0A2Z6MPR4_TRISU|nr:hypothetical protein TSUD_217180 [Trifolium subterraneum]